MLKNRLEASEGLHVFRDVNSLACRTANIGIIARKGLRWGMSHLPALLCLALAGCDFEASRKRDHEYRMECLRLGGTVTYEGRCMRTVEPSARPPATEGR